MINLTVIGNLVKDATKNEVNGKTVINFTVAHSTKYKEQEKTTYVECAYWTDKTGILPYLTKGKKVYVEGIPEAKAYTSKTGQTGANLILRVGVVELLTQSEKRENNATSAPNGEVKDDLPF